MDMMKLTRLSLLIIIIISSTALASAQGFSVEKNNPPPLTGKETFTSLDGRFTVALPQQISGFSPISFDTPKGRVTAGDSYTWRLEGVEFDISYMDTPTPFASAEDAKARLHKGADSIIASATSKGGTLVSRSDVSLGENVGHEIRLESNQLLIISRFYAAGKRVYQLTAVFKKGSPVKESAVKALDSFKLLTPDEVNAARAKKAAEAAPNPLPQEPATKKLKSDAEDEGLKGRVKTVFTEREDLSGTWAVQGRKPSSVDYYNEPGNLTKRESYDYKGNLFEVSVYGYLDGDRAMNDKTVQYEYDPPPIAVAAAPGQAKSKYDPRYHYKLKYKYDERGRLAEETWYGNDGKLWMRYVYKYDGDKKEELVYSEDGSLNQHYLYTLDGKGDEIEEISYDVKGGAIENRYSYSYEYDPKGNWTKRTTSKWLEKDGKGQFVAYSVTYRTIAYY